MTQLKRISIQFEQLNIRRIFLQYWIPYRYGQFDSETNITIRFAMISDGFYGISLARK